MLAQKNNLTAYAWDDSRDLLRQTPHSVAGLWGNHRAISRATNRRALSRRYNGSRGAAAVRGERLHESVAALRCNCNLMTGSALDETQALHMTPVGLRLDGRVFNGVS
jgi:hypothetical protein